MIGEAILAALKRLGAVVTLDGLEPVIDAPKHLLSPGDIRYLRDNKLDLVAALRSRTNQPRIAANQAVLFEVAGDLGGFCIVGSERMRNHPEVLSSGQPAMTRREFECVLEHPVVDWALLLGALRATGGLIVTSGGMVRG